MPRIQMTRTVKVALFFLRIYLIALLALIILKFVGNFSSESITNKHTSQPPSATSGQKR